ncbi:hypothetical protein [Zophobihabitans entericus]|uniref:Uncharacterized protein n=1 Tax=Zophobihabitans entericus TaxID=1635327 RepID=A0A6G9ID57_9GAMM|nr:hypothetical protein [Zophobihabitans entericus]QIQ22171.1 hypothetical protein IPMB12_11025 [Zophobihabitans entericus]
MLNIFYKFSLLFWGFVLLLLVFAISTSFYYVFTDDKRLTHARKEIETICNAAHISMNFSDFEQELIRLDVKIKPSVMPFSVNQKRYSFVKPVINASRTGIGCLILVDENNLIIKKDVL